MLKKTAVTGGLLITAAAGALVTTCSPAFAAPTHLVSNHNRNWNGSENEGLNRVRLHIRNRNNNIAVARTPQRERGDRERRDRERGPALILPPAGG